MTGADSSIMTYSPREDVMEPTLSIEYCVV